MPAGQGNQDIYGRVFGPSGIENLIGSEATILQSPDKQKLGQEVMTKVQGSEGCYSAWSGKAKEDDRFYNGNQWDDIDRMNMEQQKRPALTFNDIKPVIDAVSGMERLNRNDVRVISRPFDSPAELDMEGDLATEALSTAEDMCSASEEDSEAAHRMAVCGMAWVEIRMDYSRDINGRVIREKIPEFEMRWDPGAKKANLEDRDWCARKLKVSRKKFDKRWPDMLATVDLAVPEMPYGQTDKYELVTPYYSMGNEKANPQVGSQNAVKKDVEVIQYQWRDEETIYRLQDENTGELTSIDEDHWDTMVDRYQQLGLPEPPAVRQNKPVYKQVYVCRGVVLEDPIELPGGFSLICLTGKWDMDQKRHYGLVHPMKDPQKTKNKAISSALGFHITNAKGGVIFKTSFFADPVNAKDQWSQPNAWVEADDKADLSKDIIFRKPSEMPQELGMFYSESQKAITRSSGISEEMVGIAMGQTPSQTAKGRTQAGVVVLGWYWDNLARYRKECARVMLEFIREYWTQGQMLQVGGDYNKQSIPLLKESMPDEYSFVLDESIRHNPNLKAQVWNDMLESGTLAQLVKMNLGRVVLQLLKYSPYPAQVVADIQREVQQNPPQIPQKGQGKGAAGMQKKDDPNMVMAKTRLYGSQAEKALAQAREIDQKPALERAKLAAKEKLDQMKAQLQQQKAGQQMQMAQHKQNLQLQMQNQRNQQQMAQSWIRGMQPQQGMGGDSGMGGGDIP